MNLEMMKYYYDNGLWSLERLERLLDAKKITQQEFDYITGKSPSL